MRFFALVFLIMWLNPEALFLKSIWAAESNIAFNKSYQAFNGKLLEELSVGGIPSFCLTSDEQFALIVSKPCTVAVIQLEGMKKINTHKLVERDHLFIANVAFDPTDFSRAFFATAIGLYSWNWKTNEMPKLIVGHRPKECRSFLESAITRLVVSNDGNVVSCIDIDQQVFLVALPRAKNINAKVSIIQGSQTQLELGFIYKFGSIQYSPDCSKLAFTCQNEIVLFNSKSNKQLSRLKGHKDVVSSIIFIGDDCLLSGSWDGTSRLWNLKSGESKLIPFEKRMDEFVLVTASLERKRIACCGGDGETRIYNLPDLKPLGKFDGPKSGFSSIFYLKKRDSLIFSGESNWLQLLELTDPANKKNYR